MASKGSEERMDRPVMGWGTNAFLKIIQLDLLPHTIYITSHPCNDLLKSPHHSFWMSLIIHQCPFRQTEILSTTITAPVKPLPSLSCLSDSNPVFFFLHSCSQAAKCLHWENTDRLVSL